MHGLSKYPRFENESRYEANKVQEKEERGGTTALHIRKRLDRDDGEVAGRLRNTGVNESLGHDARRMHRRLGADADHRCHGLVRYVKS